LQHRSTTRPEPVLRFMIDATSIPRPVLIKLTATS
jgi:hypothetical protein